jgi:hypothetical protein
MVRILGTNTAVEWQSCGYVFYAGMVKLKSGNNNGDYSYPCMIVDLKYENKSFLNYTDLCQQIYYASSQIYY